MVPDAGIIREPGSIVFDGDAGFGAGRANGVVEDGGALVLSSPQLLWVTDDMDYNVGLVSKVSTQARGELARYVSVTCQSALLDAAGAAQTRPSSSQEGVVIGQDNWLNGGGGSTLCAGGDAGCCAWDSAPNGPGRQGVNVYLNRPGRVAVDINGDAWVVNHAYGRQPSVTKIAGSLGECIERNGIPGIQTSSDVNGDGLITTDCNGDNVPDDARTVCTNGRSHEFYGLDDECILFTVNLGGVDDYGRAIALVPSSSGVASDAWVGTWKNTATSAGGTLYRIDGNTGKVIMAVPLVDQQGAQVHPYGLVADPSGILWAQGEGTGSLSFVDSSAANPAAPANQGMVTQPLGGVGFYGIALDVPRDAGARIWLGEVGGSGAYRYQPVYGAGMPGLGNGTWAFVSFPGGVSQGRGIAVDARPTASAWVALDGVTGGPNGAVGRIPETVSDGAQSLPAATSIFSTLQAGTVQTAIDWSGDVWTVNEAANSLTHFAVDSSGNITNAAAPDQLTLDDNPSTPGARPLPYANGDLTGYAYRHFVRDFGDYALTLTGCANGSTRWRSVSWDADTPPGTSVSLRARTASTVAGIPGATLIGDFTSSPALLDLPPGPLVPNPSGALQLDFKLASADVTQTPVLKRIQAQYECP